MPDTRTWRILNVDDNEAGRSATTRVLKRAGFEVIEEAAGLLDVSLKNRGVSLIVDEDLPVVSGDHQRLLQVMTNLLENAVRFMGD